MSQLLSSLNIEDQLQNPILLSPNIEKIAQDPVLKSPFPGSITWLFYMREKALSSSVKPSLVIKERVSREAKCIKYFSFYIFGNLFVIVSLLIWRNIFFFFKLNVLEWYWLIKLYRLQGYNSIMICRSILN